MSILTGLKTTYNSTSSNANMVNTKIGTTDTNIKMSSVYTCGSKQYSYRSNYDQVAKFPLKNKNIDLSVKPSYTYSLVCKDTVDNTVIDPNNLTFEVISINGAYRYTTNKSSSSFNMVFENLPNDKNILITVRVTGSNYLESFAHVTSDPGVVSHTQEIGLVDINYPPSGVGVAVTSVQQGPNGTTGPVVVSVPSSNSKYEFADFTIPSGTKFYDKNGNKLTGEMSVTIGHFSPSNQTSLDLFNTGWDITNIVVDGKQLEENESIQFISGGFFILDIKDSSGNMAYSIDQEGSVSSQPITCKTSINPALTNPITNQPYAVGDVVPYWRLKKNGLWEVESNCVVKNDNGVLVFEFTTTGFSPSNVDEKTSCRLQNGQLVSRSGAVSPPPDPAIVAELDKYIQGTIQTAILTPIFV